MFLDYGPNEGEVHMAGFCEHANETSDSEKDGQLAFQEGLSSSKSVWK
jgi:hypothetical protein